MISRAMLNYLGQMYQLQWIPLCVLTYDCLLCCGIAWCVPKSWMICMIGHSSNSAWSQRWWFLSSIDLAARNESPWNYLRGCVRVDYLYIDIFQTHNIQVRNMIPWQYPGCILWTQRTTLHGKQSRLTVSSDPFTQRTAGISVDCAYLHWVKIWMRSSIYWIRTQKTTRKTIKFGK